MTSVVYYIRRGDCIKIGRTASFDRRMERLRPDALLAVEPGGRKLETARHLQFAEHNVRGHPDGVEWFRPAPDLLAHIEQVAALHDVPALLARPRTPQEKPDLTKQYELAKMLIAAPSLLAQVLTELNSRGYTFAQIGEHLGITKETASRWAKPPTEDRRKRRPHAHLDPRRRSLVMNFPNPFSQQQPLPRGWHRYDPPCGCAGCERDEPSSPYLKVHSPERPGWLDRLDEPAITGLYLAYADLGRWLRRPFRREPRSRQCRWCPQPHDLSVSWWWRILHWAGWWPPPRPRARPTETEESDMTTHQTLRYNSAGRLEDMDCPCGEDHGPSTDEERRWLLQQNADLRARIADLELHEQTVLAFVERAERGGELLDPVKIRRALAVARKG